MSFVKPLGHSFKQECPYLNLAEAQDVHFVGAVSQVRQPTHGTHWNNSLEVKPAVHSC